MDTREPVLLLDVDGVINAIVRDLSAWPADAWRSVQVPLDGYPIPVLVAQPVLDFLTRVHKAGAAEVRWHTTWQQHAPGVLAPLLQLPDFAVAPCPEFDGHTPGYGGGMEPGAPWWKLPAAERVVLGEGRRLVWLDDDLEYERHRDSELDTLLAHTGRVLGISPRPHTGLTGAHLAQVAQFLQAPHLLDG